MSDLIQYKQLEDYHFAIPHVAYQNKLGACYIYSLFTDELASWNNK